MLHTCKAISIKCPILLDVFLRLNVPYINKKWQCLVSISVVLLIFELRFEHIASLFKWGSLGPPHIFKRIWPSDCVLLNKNFTLHTYTEARQALGRKYKNFSMYTHHTLQDWSTKENKWWLLESFRPNTFHKFANSRTFCI